MIFGTQYYRPPFPARDCWKEDLREIRHIGFNTVKLWAVWSWIESRKGCYYFDDLDEIVSLCEAEGLKAVINTITEGMPYWLVSEHPDAKYITNEGLPIEMGAPANIPSGGWPGLCRDKKAVADLCDNFISAVAGHYADNSAVYAIDVWNEPHIEPAFSYPDKLFCYCGHSIENFRKWLEKKYHNITNLNKVWFRAYNSWNEVLPPLRFTTYPDMMDWRLFWLDNLSNWLEARANAARRAAPDKYIITHVPFSGYINNCENPETGLGIYLGDEFLLSGKVDKFGLSTFPKWLMKKDYIMHLLNLEFVSSASGKKEFWQSELQSGAGLTGILGGKVPTAQDIRLWNWSVIASGGKGVMYWQWRPEPSGMESPGFGLTTFEGDFSERAYAAKECVDKFTAVPELKNAKAVLPVNGIYVSRTADLFAFAAGNSEHMYAKSIYGVYGACFRQGVPICIVHQDNLEEKVKGGLQTLYLPFTLSLSKKEKEQLEDFVRHGGVLVAEACTALYDGSGLLVPAESFKNNVLGIRKQSVDKAGDVKIIWENESVDGFESFFGKEYRQDVVFSGSDVRILAKFEDNQPAVYKHTYGDGSIIWIGSFPSLYLYDHADPGCENAVTRWMKKEGYHEFEAINGGKDVLVRLLKNEDKYIIVAVNYSDADQKVEMTLNKEYFSEESTSKKGVAAISIKPSNGVLCLLPGKFITPHKSR